MRNEIRKKHILQIKRKWRVRKKMHGTAIKPRLSVIKTNKHIHVQLIDDDKGHTMAAVSTLTAKQEMKKNKESARALGEQIGKFATQNNIKEVVFDRGSHKFHGILAELADAARQAGLTF